MGCCAALPAQSYDEATGACIINPNDYIIGELLNSGGFGVVYRATRKVDYKEFAMKFFGYTDNIPTEEEIDSEIELMVSLNHLDGVLHLEGIFLDTKPGMVALPTMPKATLLPFKVIVMELATGGDLFDRIKEKGHRITERYIAKSFHTAFIALEEIHEARYLHRDLKAENLIAISKDDSSPIKLIDFGMMMKLPEGSDQLIDPQKPGTPSYVAPESYALGIYSCKSDVWQAGLSLYCTVCAEYAFDILPPSRGHFNRWKFKKGKSFALLSDSVQDLLTNMLNPIEWERISLQDALKHPWFHGEAPNVLLGESYEKKIAKLKLRGELKKFFISKDITAEAAERSAALKKNLHAAMTPRGISPFKGVPIESLHKLKEVVYEGLMAKAKRSGSFTDEGLDTILDDQPPAPLKRTYTDLILDGEVDFEGFERLMQSVNLMSMANRTIFRIFDSNNDG